MQREVDAAGDASRREYPAVVDEQDIALHPCLRVAAGQLVLEFVVRGAAMPVEHTGAAERIGSGAHAHHRATSSVVLSDVVEQACAELARPGQRSARPARNDHEVARVELRPFGRRAERHALT
jgi:hypothetical protein